MCYLNVLFIFFKDQCHIWTQEWNEAANTHAHCLTYLSRADSSNDTRVALTGISVPSAEAIRRGPSIHSDSPMASSGPTSAMRWGSSTMDRGVGAGERFPVLRARPGWGSYMKAGEEAWCSWDSSGGSESKEAKLAAGMGSLFLPLGNHPLALLCLMHGPVLTISFWSRPNCRMFCIISSATKRQALATICWVRLHIPLLSPLMKRKLPRIPAINEANSTTYHLKGCQILQIQMTLTEKIKSWVETLLWPTLSLTG